MASPDLDNKVLILTDPMLATGSTILLAYQEMVQQKKELPNIVI